MVLLADSWSSRKKGWLAFGCSSTPSVNARDWTSPVATPLAILSLSASLICASAPHYILFQLLWALLDPHTSCQAQVTVGLGCQTFSESINAVAAVLPTLGGTPLPAAAHLPQSFHPQSWVLNWKTSLWSETVLTRKLPCGRCKERVRFPGHRKLFTKLL